MAKRKTKQERLEERLALLRAIKNGEKHTKANAVLAPLSQGDLVSYESKGPPTYQITTVTLTQGGESYLDFWTKELAKGRL